MCVSLSRVRRRSNEVNLLYFGPLKHSRDGRKKGTNTWRKAADSAERLGRERRRPKREREKVGRNILLSVFGRERTSMPRSCPLCWTSDCGFREDELTSSKQNKKRKEKGKKAKDTFIFTLGETCAAKGVIRLSLSLAKTSRFVSSSWLELCNA